ncbi:Hsp33 family molecular chaperone HslO [Cohnella zeiphila]|uniref:Hsp33 family molecular chaperone HslO n=1 Tax=Cohnella zeiphila TaxID=2761120 RepID=A0A7X0SPW8_9BACL|nr:Hsp33 family molecular chaperone HslO [Cohnella zeiphila]MBB6733826.1 Hsp33 family molecular chaperone HslO [Cohnella zeiphila]
MQSANRLIKTLAYDQQVRMIFAENTELVRNVCRNPKIASMLLKTALGTTVSAASLLAGTLKDGQRINLKIKTGRPGCQIFADVDAFGNVSGYISDGLFETPPHSPEGLSLPDLIGDKGCVQIVKDIGMYRTFTGITDMPYRNIVDDLSHYFRQSEQTPACFAIHLEFDEQGEVSASRGVWAQLLPGGREELIGRVRELLDRRRMQDLPLAGPERFREWAIELFGGIEVLGEQPIRAYCGCSREMFYPMLYGLGTEQLRQIREENAPVEIACHTCGSEYSFSAEEIRALLAPRERD